MKTSASGAYVPPNRRVLSTVPPHNPLPAPAAYPNFVSTWIQGRRVTGPHSPTAHLNDITAQLQQTYLGPKPLRRAGTIPILVDQNGKTYFLLSIDGTEGFSAEYGGSLESEDTTGGVYTQLKELYEETAGYFTHPHPDARPDIFAECKKNLEQLFNNSQMEKPSNMRASFWF